MPIAFNSSVVEAQLRYESQEEEVENTLWFHTVSTLAPDGDELTRLGAALFAWYEANLQVLQHPTTLLREIYLRQAVASGGLEYTYTPILPGAGEATGAPEPGNVSLVVSFRTGLTGRSYRGRNYSIGMTSNQIDGNQADPAYLAALRDAYAALPDALELDEEFNHVVYSQMQGGAPRILGIPTLVTAYTVTNADLDSQRRRLAGRGR